MQRNNDDHAIKIQSATRGFLARRKYRIKQLKDTQLSSCETFVVGNDPMMPKELDTFNEPNEKIALVATSGMRAVSLACKLGNRKQTPKILLVDNSREVQQFWQAMRDFVANDNLAGTAELFSAHLKHFLAKNIHLYRNFPANALKNDCTSTRKYLNQDINVFFKALIDKYDYDYVRNVILHTSLIKQSWTDNDTFIKIKNILRFLDIKKVVMYPSNIISCMNNKGAEQQLLKNIEQMTPVLSIHTDRCEVHRLPERVILVTNQNPKEVSHSIFEPTKCVSSSPQHGFGQLSIDDLMIMMLAMSQSNSNQFTFKK